MNTGKYSLIAEKTRKSFSDFDNVRDSGLCDPENIRSFEDIPYGNCGEYNLLDVYCDKKTENPQKTIVSIHGGGYVYGDKKRYRYYCMDLAGRGFTVVNFSYRLAPENPYPCALEDINAVFSWIAENAGKYMIDPDNLFVVGDSAGAQLASQYIAILTNADYRSAFSFSAPFDRIKIKAEALNCGMYDLKAGSEEKNELFDAYFQGNQEKYAKQLDVLANITPDFPPAYIMTSYYDFLKEAASPLMEVLKKNNVYYTFRLYGTEKDKHMGHVFHLDIRMKEAVTCNDEECGFFNGFVS